MTPRERIRRALAHTEADRVPVDFGSRASAIEEQAYAELLKHLGRKGKVTTFVRAHAKMDEEVMDLLQVDTAWIRSVPEESWRTVEGNEVFVDMWGVPWRRPADSPYYQQDCSPLENLEQDQVLATHWELVSGRMLQDMEEQAANLQKGTPRALFSDHIGAGIFEQGWYLRGFQKLLTELMIDKLFVHRFFDKILTAQLEAYDKLLDRIGRHIEGVIITDDLATQENLLMSRDLYREMIQPYHRRLLKFIQDRGVKVVFHCCGAIRSLLPDLIDAGVRILHPVQTSASGMDPVELKRQFGADLTLWGGGCDTAILQFGTEADVREEVKRRVGELAPGGGFVFSTTHCIQPGTPPQNILAMVSALGAYGGYDGQGR